MECPACGNNLSSFTAADVTVDVCRGGCGGIWFDQLELRKVDERDEAAGEALLGVPRDPDYVQDYFGTRHCPKCDHLVMMRHFFSPKRKVEVDECPACGGFWLDAGELAAIRSLYDSDADRKAAAHAYFHDLFGDRLAEMAAGDQASLEKVRRVVRLFRFICPTYYIPGDQPWGAF